MNAITLSLAPLLAFTSQPLTQDVWEREALARIDVLARNAIERDGVSGLAIAVLKGEELWLAKGFGYGDPAQQELATAGTLFPIGTVGRQLTAAAVLRLVDAHEVGIDDPLEKWVTGFPNGIRLRHLLAGTSGITGPAAWVRTHPELLDKDVAEDELLAVLRAQPLDFEPGRDFAKESAGYAVLAMVVAKASGGSYAEYVAREVLEPLGLGGIQVCRPEKRAVGFAADCKEPEMDLPLQAQSAGFGLHWCAPVTDLVRLERALVDRSLLEESSVRLLTTPIDLPSGRSTGHGFALEIARVGDTQVYSHTGGTGGFRVRTAHYVDPDVTVAVLANCHSAPVDALEAEIARAVLGWPPRAVAEIDLPADAEARYAGTYQLATTRIVIRVNDGKLELSSPNERLTLLYQGRHVFAAGTEKDSWITFAASNGRADSFTWTRGGYASLARRME